ncbi:MAG: hypothetical protein LUG83_05960 [Lachnospiraceae bacterium]|nr:hypothetical protein [Lachnospiraceae bacterium]
MFDILLEEKIITAFIFSFFVISILLQLLLCMLYENMLQETENMAVTENKLLKQCKLKFFNCYQLNNGVANIPVFVDKFLSRLALGHISFESVYHLSGQAMLLSIVGAGAGVCKSIMEGRRLVDILPFYIVSLFELYIYFSLTTLFDIKGRKKTLKINLIDYLENHLSSRIDITEGDMEMLYGNASANRRAKRGRRRTIEFTPIMSRMPENGQQTGIYEEKQKNSDEAAEKDAGAGIFTGEQEKELECLLKEFLTS